jgi:hypothetical protein
MPAQSPEHFPKTHSQLDQLVEGYLARLDLSAQTGLIAQLDHALTQLFAHADSLDRRYYDPAMTSEQALAAVSEQRLSEIERTEGDKAMAGTDQNQIPFSALIFKQLTQQMAQVIYDVVQPTGHVQLFQSGRNWYPPGGYMGWHTNSNVACFRFYCNHAETGDASFFRYRNPVDGEIITSWDRAGWNFRCFRTDLQPLWHCVYSATNRVSFGYSLRFVTSPEGDS